MIIAIIILISLLPVSFLIGRSMYKKHVNKILKTGTGKLGIIIYSAYAKPINYVIEVEELETAEKYTKVKVIRVCSCKDSWKSTKSILSSKSFNEWVETKSIIWYDNNSQRLRDEKLKKLLNNE